MSKKVWTDWPICGRIIGQATGWDQGDTFEIILYDFKPAAGYSGPVDNDVTINYELGRIKTYSSNGDITGDSDLLQAISRCEMKP